MAFGSGRKERRGASNPATSLCSRRPIKKSLQVSEALREAEVPFAFYKQEGLFQTDQARAIHDLLAAIADPADARQTGSRLDHSVLRRSAGRVCPIWTSSPTRIRSSSDFATGMNWPASADSRCCSRKILDESGIIRRELFLKDDERALTNYLHIFEVLLEEARTGRP